MCNVDPKSIQNGALGGPWVTPGASLGPPRELSGLDFRRNWRCLKKMTNSGRLPGRPGRSPGTQRDSKNRLKIGVLLQKGIRDVIFLWILVQMTVLHVFFAWFCIDFARKINEKVIRKTICFCIALFDFWNMATLTKHCILRCESNFFIFLAVAFFLKK